MNGLWMTQFLEAKPGVKDGKRSFEIVGPMPIMPPDFQWPSTRSDEPLSFTTLLVASFAGAIPVAAIIVAMAWLGVPPFVN